jgi:hypothetical protein
MASDPSRNSPSKRDAAVLAALNARENKIAKLARAYGPIRAGLVVAWPTLALALLDSAVSGWFMSAHWDDAPLRVRLAIAILGGWVTWLIDVWFVIQHARLALRRPP